MAKALSTATATVSIHPLARAFPAALTATVPPFAFPLPVELGLFELELEFEPELEVVADVGEVVLELKLESELGLAANLEDCELVELTPAVAPNVAVGVLQSVLTPSSVIEQ